MNRVKKERIESSAWMGAVVAAATALAVASAAQAWGPAEVHRAGAPAAAQRRAPAAKQVVRGRSVAGSPRDPVVVRVYALRGGAHARPRR